MLEPKKIMAAEEEKEEDLVVAPESPTVAGGVEGEEGAAEDGEEELDEDWGAED